MAALDSTTNTFIDSATSVQFADGAGVPATLTLGLRQGFIDLSWTGRPVTTSRNAGRIVGGGIVNYTGDGEVTGTFRWIVSTWVGNTNDSPHDFVTNTGTAGSLTSTGGGGNAFRCKVTVTYTADDDSTTQTLVIAAAHFNSFTQSDAGDGKIQIEGSFTAEQNYPTFA